MERVRERRSKRERRVKIRRGEGREKWMEEMRTVFRYAHVKRRTFKEIP